MFSETISWWPKHNLKHETTYAEPKISLLKPSDLSQTKYRKILFSQAKYRRYYFILFYYLAKQIYRRYFRIFGRTKMGLTDLTRNSILILVLKIVTILIRSIFQMKFYFFFNKLYYLALQVFYTVFVCFSYTQK